MPLFLSSWQLLQKLQKNALRKRLGFGNFFLKLFCIHVIPQKINNWLIYSKVTMSIFHFPANETAFSLFSSPPCEHRRRWLLLFLLLLFLLLLRRPPCKGGKRCEARLQGQGRAVEAR